MARHIVLEILCDAAQLGACDGAVSEYAVHGGRVLGLCELHRDALYTPLDKLVADHAYAPDADADADAGRRRGRPATTGAARFTCDTCGEQFSTSGVRYHQRRTGHLGKTRGTA